MIVTQAGVYSDMPEQIYHGDPVPDGSLSCSGAKLLLPPGCPAIYDWTRKQPRQPTQAMEFGTAAHREVLGVGWPFEVWDGKQDDLTTKAAREWAAAARARGAVPLLRKHRQQITEMAAAIRSHPTAALLLTAEDVWPERSLFWFDEAFGIWRRARMDAVNLGGRVMIVDYKTARSADPGEFARAAGRLGYHWQDPWYREAVRQVLGDADPAFLFAAQEKEPPYLVGIYELNEESRLAGEARCEAACREFARCQAAGEWPGYQLTDELVTRIAIPRWAL